MTSWTNSQSSRQPRFYGFHSLPGEFCRVGNPRPRPSRKIMSNIETKTSDGVLEDLRQRAEALPWLIKAV
jgi:hypothetical protein